MLGNRSRDSRSLWARVGIGVAAIIVWNSVDASEPSNAEASPLVSRSEAFVDSIGFNTHMNFSDSPKWTNPAAVVRYLQYLGVRQVRDQQPAVNPAHIGAAPHSVYTGMMRRGIKFDFFADGQPFDPKATISVLEGLAAAAPGGIAGIEGFNEIDNFPVTYRGQTGPAAAAAAQLALYKGLKASRILASIPVHDLSHGYIDRSLFADYAGRADTSNIHAYPKKGLPPGQAISSELGAEYSELRPGVITEFGYYTYTTGVSKPVREGTYWGGVSEARQGKLLLDGIFESWIQGFSRMYIYQLLDGYEGDSPEQHFGIIAFDGTLKPAAKYIHNLTTILGDTSANAMSFSVGTLEYKVTGLPDTAHTLLLQKANGVFDIVIWNEAENWDPITRLERREPEHRVQIMLGTEPDHIRIYDLTESAYPVRTLPAQSLVEVGVTDHAIIVEFEPHAVRH